MKNEVGARVYATMHATCVFFVTCVMLGATALAETEAAKALREKEATAFVSVVSGHFADWDTDKDGLLQAIEVNSAVCNSAIAGDEAAAVAALKRATRSKTFTMPPLSLKNLTALALATPARDQPNLGSMFASGQKKISEAGRQLFPQGMPKLEALRQGKLGNCFCLAPLGAMLHRDANQVQAMFQPQSDGTCEVTLGKNTLKVPMPTDAEIAISSSTEASGIWSNTYEKAVGLARIAENAGRDRDAIPVDALTRGGSAGTMLAAITGHEIVRFSCTFARDIKVKAPEAELKLAELRKLLIDAVKEKRLITTGTNSRGPSGPTVPGIRGGHAYAVLGYDAGTDEIRLWDPHGDTFVPKGEAGSAHGYPRQDGLFAMPLPVFARQYGGLAFEQLPDTITTAGDN
jgi:hypothetical protein